MPHALNVQNVFAPNCNDRPWSLQFGAFFVSAYRSLFVTRKTAQINQAGIKLFLCIPILTMNNSKKSKSLLPVKRTRLKILLWRFRQICKFWQPILAVAAAIVSILVALWNR